MTDPIATECVDGHPLWLDDAGPIRVAERSVKRRAPSHEPWWIELGGEPWCPRCGAEIVGVRQRKV
jgi:hypothetical protein